MENKEIKFIKQVEHRITLDEIIKVNHNAKKLMKTPRWLQELIVNKTSGSNQYMGFVVEPYSVFLSFQIDEETIKDLLPNNYELAPISIFSNTKPYTCAILGCFNVRTSVFWGIRYELYIIARNKKSNLISWIICDYESNTYNYDPGNGFKPQTVDNATLTTMYDAKIICNIINSHTNNSLDFSIDISKFKQETLNQTLWIEGNLSVDYAGKLGSSGKDPFGLIFNPQEMKEAHKIKNRQIQINQLQFGFINKSFKIAEICYFPYAQHYITTVFPQSHSMRTVEDLYKQVEELADNKKL